MLNTCNSLFNPKQSTCCHKLCNLLIRATASAITATVSFPPKRYRINLSLPVRLTIYVLLHRILSIRIFYKENKGTNGELINRWIDLKRSIAYFVLFSRISGSDSCNGRNAFGSRSKVEFSSTSI